MDPGDTHGLATRVTACFTEAFRLEGTEVTVKVPISYIREDDEV